MNSDSSEMAPYSPVSNQAALSESDILPALRPVHPLRPPPPFLIPEPFDPLLSTSHRNATNKRGDDDDAASISEASSITAGRASTDLLEYARDDDDDDAYGEVGKRERDGLLAEGADLEAGVDGKRPQRTRRVLFLVLLLPALLLLFPLLHTLYTRLLEPTGAVHLHRFDGKGLKKLSLEEIKNGTWYAERVALDWVGGAAPDGTFSQRLEDGSIALTSLAENATRVLVNGDDLEIDYDEFTISADLEYVLLSVGREKQWRHSSLSSYHLHRVSPPLTLPLHPSDQHSSSDLPPALSLAVLSPTAHSLAFVHQNDLYVLPASLVDEAFEATSMGEGLEALGKRTVRVTNDGGADRFNGVCDWVYEEEVFSDSRALWFSPTSSHIAFLSFNETSVPTYDVPVYNTRGDEYSREGAADAYPSKMAIRYPKAGYPNPLVTLHLFSLSSYLSSPSRPSFPTSSSSSSSQSSTLSPSVLSSLSLLTLDKPFPPLDNIISEVAWVGEAEMVVKQTGRDARVERVGWFEVGTGTGVGGEGGQIRGRTVRETDWVERDGGWAESAQNIHPLLPIPSALTSATTAPIPTLPQGYLDILPNKDGFMQIAFFPFPSESVSASSAKATGSEENQEPVWLTGGEWEIDGKVLSVDAEQGFAYILAARPSTSRHVLRIALPRSQADLTTLRASGPIEPVQLTANATATALKQGNQEEGGGAGAGGVWYTASFSARGGWFVENYEGLYVPRQRLRKVEDDKYSLTLADNADLAALDKEYQHAQLVYSTISVPVGGNGNGNDNGNGNGKNTKKEEMVEVNAMEIRPPNMDLSGRTKYPVLVQVYGGPNSQTITQRFTRDWHHYLTLNHGYIILRIDGRGTGLRGRKFRTTVRGRLGEVESRDVVEAVRKYGDINGWVDRGRVGIWGWSYGGFLTTKVIETNSSLFSLGMAVAPVTVHDSIYTERYMSTPELNPAGYRNSSVHRMDGFLQKDVTFALAHGTGDDNVHAQNTFNLLDRFTIAGVRNFHLRMFTDSDHSISTRNAYWELMAWLEELLLEHWGEGGRTKQRWRMTAGERTEKRV
ncbi:hypothetical protein JCM11641_001188 [Rhodosporidiobolus odoratus]